jgi:hypothetical protein
MVLLLFCVKRTTCKIKNISNTILFGVCFQSASPIINIRQNIYTNDSDDDDEHLLGQCAILVSIYIKLRMEYQWHYQFQWTSQEDQMLDIIIF